MATLGQKQQANSGGGGRPSAGSRLPGGIQDQAAGAALPLCCRVKLTELAGSRKMRRKEKAQAPQNTLERTTMAHDQSNRPSEEPQLEEMDMRGLEPPQPMVRIMGALEEMASGGRLAVLLDRKPVYLLPLLEEAGHTHTISQRDGETWELVIAKG